MPTSYLSGLHYSFSWHGMSVNPSKSEAILFGTHQRLRTFPHLPSVEFDGTGKSANSRVQIQEKATNCETKAADVLNKFLYPVNFNADTLNNLVRLQLL